MAKKKPGIRYFVMSYLDPSIWAPGREISQRTITLVRIEGLRKVTGNNTFCAEVHGSKCGYKRKSKALRLLKEHMIRAHLEGRAYIERE